MLTIILSIIIGLIIGFGIQIYRSKIHSDEVILVFVFSLCIGLLMSLMIIPKQFTYKYEVQYLSRISNEQSYVYTVDASDNINCICKTNNILKLYTFEKDNTSFVVTKHKPFVLIKRKIIENSIWYISETNNIVKTLIYINNVN